MSVVKLHIQNAVRSFNVFKQQDSVICRRNQDVSYRKYDNLKIVYKIVLIIGQCALKSKHLELT